MSSTTPIFVMMWCIAAHVTRHTPLDVSLKTVVICWQEDNNTHLLAVSYLQCPSHEEYSGRGKGESGLSAA